LRNSWKKLRDKLNFTSKENMTDAQANQDGVAHFHLLEVDLHRGELHAVFRTWWEGRQCSDFGVKKDKSISMKDYVKLTVVEINKVENEGLLLLPDPPRSSAKIKLLMDNAPVPGYPEVMTIKVGQTLTVQSTKRALEAAGIKKVRRI